MPTAPYSLWLRGSDTYFQTTPSAGVDSLVTTGVEAAPTVIGTPSLANGWLRVYVWGTNPEIKDEGEKRKALSGNQYNDPIPRWMLTIATDDYSFPADWASYKALQQHLAKRYLYIAQETYPVTLHSGATCLAVTREWSTEHDYGGGSKSLEITVSMRASHEEL